MDSNSGYAQLITFLIFLGIAANIVASAASTMIVEVSPSTIISEEYFTISVYDPSITNETPYLTNVIIQFNKEIYTISSDDDSGEISIQAPDVLVNTSFLINAFKEGYSPTNKTILVIPGDPTLSFELHIILLSDTYEIKAYDQFTILVTNLDGIPINGATVEIQGFEKEGYVTITDANGEATLTAPNIKEINLLTKKHGYIEKELKLEVNMQLDSFELLLNYPYLPVAIAAIILITVILYVSGKNRLHSSDMFVPRSVKPQSIQLSNKNQVEHDPAEIPEKDRLNILNEKNNPKIEEIHISSSTSKKEVVSLEISKDKKPNQKPGSYHWFENSTEVDGKVDKLPETSTRNNINAWFVGTDNIRKKIDETIQEKDKDKKKEKE